MNLNKFINMQLLMLSKKYDISIVEVTKVIDNQIKKSITVNHKKKTKNALNRQMHFFSKKELVSWLMCLN